MEGATERQHHSRYSQTTGGREGGPAARPLQLALIQGADAPVRSRDFSAKGLSLTDEDRAAGLESRLPADRLPVASPSLSLAARPQAWDFLAHSLCSNHETGMKRAYALSRVLGRPNGYV